MDTKTFKQYMDNLGYLQELVSKGHKLALLPVTNKEVTIDGKPMEQVALCTQDPDKEEDIFPHAIMVWSNPFEILTPIQLDEGVTPDANSDKVTAD